MTRIPVGAIETPNASLPHLETFSKAAEAGSFTRAAKALDLTQAAVSQRIQALEKTLATALFLRKGGRVHLTEAGRRLYDYAQRILDLHQEARREITGRRTPPAGELLLSASSIPGEHLLPALLGEFRRLHPHIQVRAAVSDSMTALSEVERGQAHLGLVGRKTDQLHLEFRLLTRDRMVLVVPPTHALGRRKRIQVKELCRHPLILREPGSGLRHCFEKSLEKAGKSVADLRVTLELGSNEAIKEAVRNRAGVAVLSALAVDTEVRAGRLHAVEVADLQCDRDIYLVHDRRRALPLAARQFLIFLETHPVHGAPR